MADIIYLTLKGNRQGLISAGCSNNVAHAPFLLVKADDKSSPLLLSSISDNEILDCVFDYYRISQQGMLINYKRIRLTKASVIRIVNQSPDSLIHNDLQPAETISLKYESITYQHISAGTSGYSIRNDSVR